MAGRMPVQIRRERLGPQLAGKQFSPDVVRKKRRVWNTGAEVEWHALREQICCPNGVPEGPRTKHATGARLPRSRSRACDVFVDECSRTDARKNESFTGQTIVCDRHGHAGDAQATRHLSGRWQWVSGTKPPVDDRAAHLSVDLPAQVLSSLEADVKLHGSASRFANGDSSLGRAVNGPLAELRNWLWRQSGFGTLSVTTRNRDRCHPERSEG